MKRPKKATRHWITLMSIALIVGLVTPVAASAARPTEPDPVSIRFLTYSDWHGQLDPLFIFGEGTFGGAAELSTYFQLEEADNPNTLIITGGDDFGASLPLSNFFDEVPAVQSQRMMGTDVSALGNHNFDAGVDHLQSMINLAKKGGDPGDRYYYVSANLENVDDNLDGVKPFRIFDVGGIDVAVIGVTNPDAQELVFPGSFGTISVTDPIAAANSAREKAEKKGADVFVLVAHMGIDGFDGGGAAFGPLVDLASGVSGFDLVVGDHTNFEYTDTINGPIVVENRSRGVSYARVDMVVQQGAKKKDPSVVLSASVEIVDAVSADVIPDPDIVAYLAPLREELDELLGVVIGQSTVQILRSDECGQSSGRTCESLIGNVVTDAMRDRYGTDFAITNSGGLRAALTCPLVDSPTDFCPPADGGDHEITAGQVLTVLPFGNTVATVTVTGAELKAHLERGVAAMPGVSGRFAQVSGLCFTYDIDLTVGSRVTGAVFQNADGTCSASAVDLTAGSSYTLAENDFMSSGGDGYPVDIGSATTRELLDQVVSDYVSGNTPISPIINGRITCTASGGGTCPTP